MGFSLSILHPQFVMFPVSIRGCSLENNTKKKLLTTYSLDLVESIYGLFHSFLSPPPPSVCKAEIALGQEAGGVKDRKRAKQLNLMSNKQTLHLY